MPGPGQACRTGRMYSPQALYWGGRGWGEASTSVPLPCPPEPGLRRGGERSTNTQQVTLCSERLPSITFGASNIYRLNLLFLQLKDKMEVGESGCCLMPCS